MFNYIRNSTYEAPSPKYIEQWKRKLTPRQVQLAEARIGEMLTQRGYEPSGHPRLRVSPVSEKLLVLRSRLRRVMYRRKQFGNSLFLADLISRRTGPDSWRCDVTRRMDAVIEKTLK